MMQLPKTETALNGIKCSRTANDQNKSKPDAGDTKVGANTDI